MMSARLLPAACAAALLLGACGTGPPVAAPTPTADPAIAEIRDARAVLGEPTVSLAEAVLALREVLDGVRHDVERGAPMRTALAEVGTAATAVRAAADEAEEAVASLDPADPGAATADSADPGAASTAEPETPAVREALAIVVVAVEQARAAAAAAEAEQEALARLADADRRLEAAAAERDTPGSQSERRSELAQLADEAEALAEEIRALELEPQACPALREHRVGWAELLAERFRRLADTATSGGGAEHDELRQAFAREPFGERRLDADAADRACWLEASAVAQAASAAPEHVGDLEAALNP